MPDREIWKEFEKKGKAAGLTQIQLAAMVGVSPRYLRKLKTGERSGAEIVERKHAVAGLYQVKIKRAKDKTISQYVRIPEATVRELIGADGVSEGLSEILESIQERYAVEGDYKRPRILFTPRKPVTRVKVWAL